MPPDVLWQEYLEVLASKLGLIWTTAGAKHLKKCRAFSHWFSMRPALKSKRSFPLHALASGQPLDNLIELVANDLLGDALAARKRWIALAQDIALGTTDTRALANSEYVDVIPWFFFSRVHCYRLRLWDGRKN